MKSFFYSALKVFAVAASLVVLTSTARANVYATDIKVNGSLSGITNAPTPGSPATITYILNQAATLGCTVRILNGNITVATIGGGTAVGLNTVLWGGTNQAGSPAGGGSYSISITASASDLSGGTTNWTQISVDSSNTACAYPLGMDVDKNTNSPYYGRVVIGNAVDASAHGVTEKTGLYKANADASPADEGAFGFADYTTNDAAFTASGEMTDQGQPYHGVSTPGIIRIGEDDRIYFIDQSETGAVIASDMQATTNQIVICEGPGFGSSVPPSVAFSSCPNSYAQNPDGALLNYYGEGWGQFDVAGFATGHPAIYLCDTGDYPSAGIWMYHLTNGAADPNDTVGTQAVAPNANISTFAPTNMIVAGGGVTVDDNLDIFVADDRSDTSTNSAADPSVICDRIFCFTNWNGGILPPEGAGANTYPYLEGTVSKWGVGTLSDQLSGINDTVINSRSHPTMVAVAMLYGSTLISNGFGGQNSGIAILNASDGSYVATNLDVANTYTGVAFDNVGNVYGCSTSTNYWRVWSPPGANTNTTVAVAQVVIPSPLKITSITSSPGCVVTITFTSPGTPAPSAFRLLGSATVNGTYTDTGATITGGAGSYQTTVTNCSTQFYMIKEPAQLPAD